MSVHWHEAQRKHDVDNFCRLGRYVSLLQLYAPEQDDQFSLLPGWPVQIPSRQWREPGLEQPRVRVLELLPDQHIITRWVTNRYHSNNLQSKTTKTTLSIYSAKCRRHIITSHELNNQDNPWWFAIISPISLSCFCIVCWVYSSIWMFATKKMFTHTCYKSLIDRISLINYLS